MPKGIYKRKPLSKKEKLRTIKNLGKYAQKGSPSWNKGKKMDANFREKCRQRQIGHTHPKKTREKISRLMKEQYLNGIRKSQIGKKLSRKTKLKISMCGKKMWRNQKQREKIMLNMRGRKLTLEQRKNLGKAKKGKKNPMYGLKGNKCPNFGRMQSKETKEKISKSRYGKCTGKDHHNWNNGSSFEPYDKSFNNKFKRAIRKRDNQICMLCGIHREKLKRALCVHHIDYNKLNTFPQNCISLCHLCHMGTNKNREYWEKIFQSILNKNSGYGLIHYSRKGTTKVLQKVKDIQTQLKEVKK